MPFPVLNGENSYSKLFVNTTSLNYLFLQRRIYADLKRRKIAAYPVYYLSLDTQKVIFTHTTFAHPLALLRATSSTASSISISPSQFPLPSTILAVTFSFNLQPHHRSAPAIQAIRSIRRRTYTSDLHSAWQREAPKPLALTIPRAVQPDRFDSLADRSLPHTRNLTDCSVLLQRITSYLQQRKFRFNRIPPELEQKLEIIFSRIVATGNNVWIPNSGILPYEATNEQHNSSDENDHHDDDPHIEVDFIKVLAKVKSGSLLGSVQMRCDAQNVKVGGEYLCNEYDDFS
ncbi:hypothetical protein IEQ34_018097 [Dendrobium chrysotoxum]|uniref:Uncharacterized protein n=1 Tax=Dendrobium chrysotoxum TaxID=161865 RepID=A0AAV7GDK6_DENCH|nr:hypothetical protein IEQ34_018097 [Dendrobium chrysotoxum]